MKLQGCFWYSCLHFEISNKQHFSKLYLVSNYNTLSAEYAQTRMGHYKSFNSFINAIHWIVNQLLRHFRRV